MALKPLPPSITKISMAEWSNLKIEFIWLYEAEVDPEYRNLSDHFPGQSAILLRKGSMLVENEKGRVTARTGQWIFPKQGRRLQRFSNDARVLSLHFNLHWAAGQPLFDWDTALVFNSAVAPQLETQLDQLRRLVNRKFPRALNRLPWATGDLSTHLMLQNHFLEWVQTYTRTLLGLGLVPSRLGLIDPRILDAAQKLDNHPLGIPFRFGDLATGVGLSISQLDRLFSKHFGLTPAQYLDRRRLQVAMTQVSSSSDSIKHISYKLGFASLPYFSRWFRNKTGYSPRGFQQAGPEFQARPKRGV